MIDIIELIKNIRAVKILEFTTTKGSAPLKVLGEDNNIYYAKTTEISSPPFQELINELICNYYANIWGLKSPFPALIEISNDIINDYIEENNFKLPLRYSNTNFSSKPFIGFQLIEPQVEIEKYINGLSGKVEYNLFASPMDFVKIALFDLWICNKDRKPDNPNVLLSETNAKFTFHPIDHTAAFGHQSNLKSVKEVHLYLEEKNCLISTHLSSNILNIAPRTVTKNLNSNILENINLCMEQSDNIFSKIPSSWGFSKNAQKNIVNLLSNPNRNKNISDSYLRLIK